MKINISFKNVGQGDTIFLEWEDAESKQKKFGLIDCNLVDDGIAPVITHIESQKPRLTEFDFIIMSHPHSDHFSGFPLLFDYCRINNITIRKFFFTAALDPDRLKSFLDKDAENRMKALMTASVNRISPDGFIKEVVSIDNDYLISSENGINLRFWSPFQLRDVDKYIASVLEVVDGGEQILVEKSENNPQANLLSTVLRIAYKSDWQILLCSDVTAYTLEKILGNSNKFGELRKVKLLTAQIPHHGSKYNHVAAFWQQLKEIEDSEIIISVGNRYNHPSLDVVNFFRSTCKAVHATNFVGGYRDSFKEKPPGVKVRKMVSLAGLPRFRRGSKAGKTSSGHPSCCEKRLSINIDDSGHTQFKVVDC